MNDLSNRAVLLRRRGLAPADVLAGAPVSAPLDDQSAIEAALDLPVVSKGLRPADPVTFVNGIASGIVPLAPNPDGFRYAVAPTPRTLPIMIRHGLIGRTDLALMPQAAFRSMLRGHCAAEIADHAAHALPRHAPLLSARGGMTRAQYMCLLITCGLFIAGLWVNSDITLLAAALLTLPLFIGLVLLRCGAAIEAWGGQPPQQPRLRDDDLPVYTVLVPLHREAAIVPQLVSAMRALDYPHDRLEIKFIIEHDDHATHAALASAGMPAHMEIVVAPEGQPRTKPRALNAGLMEARGSLVTIYDAEDRPDPRQLRTAANLFARLPAEVACLQGRLVIDNVDDSWLTRLFAMEYAGLFDVINAGLIRAGLPVLLGGTSNHFRAAALRHVHGWDAFNVTEDADLAVRLVRAGYRIADLPSATLEEAPSVFRLWFGQRTRWMKGFLQTAITHTRQPLVMFREAGLAAGLTLLALCGGTLLSALAYPVLLAAAVWTLCVDGFPVANTMLGALAAGLWITVFCAGLASILLPAAVGLRQRGLHDLWIWLPLMPIYFCLISLAAWAAVIEQMTAPTRWNKTEHGRARTSRSSSRGHAASPLMAKLHSRRSP